ncbi:MAG: HAD-IB family hydrolase [Acidimicrobiales bacterium]|jgi:phosphatidylglycerophosphatase C
MADVAAFDFDGTLTRGGSVFDFLAAVAGREAVLRATAELAPRLVQAALAGGTVADDTKERLFVRVLGGVDAERFHQVAQEFAVRHMAAHARPEVRRRLDWHRGRGDKVAIVSASPLAYVEVVADRLAADTAIATVLEVDDAGRLTGRYEGDNCRGEEKIRRLRLWMAETDSEGSHLWAYGNSRGDLRMLHAADTGVNVGRLGPLSRLREFRGLDETGPPRLDH